MQESIGNKIAPAIIQALIVCIVRFFTIPWSIWSGAVMRLASARAASVAQAGAAVTEFPVFEWFKNAWDGAIFLSWFIGVLIALGALVGVGLEGLLGGLITTYFIVIPISLAKESMILLLSIALNVEKIVTLSQRQQD